VLCLVGTAIQNSDIRTAMQMSSRPTTKRKYAGRDDAADGGRDESGSSVLPLTGVLTTRNKLQRSDCSDVGSSYNKLMLQDAMIMAAAATKQP
jgi:hypothetical protein